MPLKLSQPDPSFRHFGFRRFLALAQLLIYVTLLIIGYYQIQQAAGSQQPRLRPLAYEFQQNPHELTPNPHRNLPRTWKLAIALNVPATLMAGLIAAIVLRQPGNDAYILVLAMPFVPLLWHFIGRWLDYELRFLPRPRRSTIRIVIYVMGILIAAFGLFSSVVSYTHGAISSSLVMTALWSLLILLMSVTALLRPTPKPA